MPPTAAPLIACFIAGTPLAWHAGTSACPNGHFYCRNKGFVPLLLNSSMVDDSICGALPASCLGQQWQLCRVVVARHPCLPA